MYASERDMRVHQLQVARASEDETLPGRGFAYRLHAHNPPLAYVLYSSLRSSPQSRSKSFVPLDQRTENESSGSIHFEIIKRKNRILVIRFTAQSQSGSRTCYGAWLFLCWLLPELSFTERWSRGTKLWERDCLPRGFLTKRKTACSLRESNKYFTLFSFLSLSKYILLLTRSFR